MKKSRITGSLYLPKFVAEREGFEPPDPFGSTVFKTAAIDHSATSPYFRILYHFFFASAGFIGVVFTRSTIFAVTSGFAFR